MNETTWIISPDGLVWTLLTLATLSLMVIAYCIAKTTIRKNKSVPSALIEPEKSHRTYTRVSMIFSIIACLLALVAFGGSLFNISSTDASVPISILGAIVTALVGWQVYNAIDLQRTLREMNDAENRFQTKAEDLQRQIKQGRTENEATLFYEMGQHILHSVDVTTRGLVTGHSLSQAYECFLEALSRFINANSPNRHLNLCLGSMSVCLQLLDEMRFASRIFENCERTYTAIINGGVTLSTEIRTELDRLHDIRVHIGVDPDEVRLRHWSESRGEPETDTPPNPADNERSE